MIIEFTDYNKKYIAEVWSDISGGSNFTEVKEPYDETMYVEINNWCIKTFGYHARTAYHIFEFKKKADLEWFVLKWA